MVRSIRHSLAAATTAVIAVVILVPALASAFTGNLVNCSPTAGIAVPVTVSPGLTCANTLSTVTLSATTAKASVFDNCVANPAVPWDIWAAAGYGSEISAAKAATISKVEFKITAVGFQPCKATGNATSGLASGGGTFKFLNTETSHNVVSKGKGSFFGTITIVDVTLASAVIRGIVTKDFGIGGAIEARVHLDLAHPGNAQILACNVGTACPPAVPAITSVKLKTAAPDFFRIDFPDNANCTGAHTPMYCCLGPALGTC